MNTETGIPIRVIRSSRKSIALEVTPEGEVRVRAPNRVSREQIQRFVEEKEEWIRRHVILAEERQARRKQQICLTYEEIQKLADEACKVIPPRVAYFASKVGVSYGQIMIRNQRTRWGSCSGKGNLNFNCLLLLAPPEILDYVIVHELCHRKEMNHSPRFWAEVERVLPDYRQAKRWLKERGGDLIARME